MISIVLILSSILIIWKDSNQKEILTHNYIVNSIAFESGIPKSRFDDIPIYDGLSLNEIGSKIDKVLNSNLKGYGKTIAALAIEKDVDPYIAASIILVETGCKWNCSYLTKNCNNVGGMKGSGCGSYAAFSDLDVGLDAFIRNLARNYYAYGLNTPELMNRKYAENPNWHKDVNYYINLIKAS